MSILASEKSKIKNKKKTKKRFDSHVKRKIILLLQAGLALGLIPSPKAHFYIFKELVKEWKEIDRQYLYRIVREFHVERLVEWKEKPDGSFRVVLTKEGEKMASGIQFDQMEIKKPAKWDNKWRVVMFDVPEKQRRIRDALREKLRQLGFYEMQKSVFIFPYPCRNEIDFVVEFFKARLYVRYAEMSNLTNETELKIKFGLR